jgi:CubicO group peptidase (beta-lactamase class C family)
MSELQHKIEGLLAGIQARTGVPGLSVALSVDGLRIRTAVGNASSDSDVPLSPQSRFQTGCIAKMLTSLVVLELARERILSLDATVGEYLQELKGRAITIRHLATHTSGFQGLNVANTESAYYYSWEKFVDFFHSMPQTVPAGLVFNYDHSESVILGEVVKRVTGKTPDQLARELLFEPLGIRLGTVKTDASDPQVNVANHAYDATTARYRTLRTMPYCAFWSHSLPGTTIATSDLALLAEALAGSTRCRLAPSSIAEARQRAISVPMQIGGPRREHTPTGFGFGCAQYSRQLLGHNGSARGQTCGIRFDPANRMVIVVALNAWQPHLRDLILNLIAETIRPLPPTGETAADWRLEEMEGSYTGCVQGTSIDARMDDSQLMCKLSNTANNSTSTFRWSRDRAGQVTLEADAPHLSAGFFREKTQGLEVMMVGLNAFRKVS